jgi:tetratricopeptide (TPR) repeat protein
MNLFLQLARLAYANSLFILLFAGHYAAQQASVLADIIAPATTPRTGQEAPGIPENLLFELEPQVAQRMNDPVRSFLSDRDLPAFKMKYSAIKESTDSLPAVEVFLGKLFAAYNQPADALAVLEQYTNQSPEDPEAFVTMGNIALKSGRVIDAWLHLQHAQRLIGQNRLPEGRKAFVLPVLIELQASTAERRKFWDEAEKLFLQLARLKPELNYPTWRAGRIKVMAGQIEQGFDLMHSAHQKDPKLPPASLSVAQTLHDTSDWINNPELAAQVEAWYKRSVTENIENSEGWASYLKWLILSDRPVDVVDAFDSLPPESRQDRELLLMRGLAARYLGDLVTAEQIFSAAHQANPQDIEIADQLALVLIESSDEAKRGRALQLAERNLRQLPQAEVTVATAAWIQLKLGAVDVADRLLSQLAARGNLSPQTAFYIADLMDRSGQTEESRQLLTIAVESPGIFPQRAQVKRRLGGGSPSPLSP